MLKYSICLATVAICGIQKASVGNMESVWCRDKERRWTNCSVFICMYTSCQSAASLSRRRPLLLSESEKPSKAIYKIWICVWRCSPTDQGRKWVSMRSAAESGAFSLTCSRGCASAVRKTATRVEHPRFCIWICSLNPMQTLHACHFSKIFYFDIDPSTRK